MKLLVCISKTPDTTTKISFTDNDTKFNADRVQWILNPYDEWYALVKALELKEAHGGSVAVINVGGADCDPIIRKALAIGADNAIRVNANPTDAYYVAAQIAEHAKTENYDCIFTGKETIDYNGSQVGGMVAELLNLPFVSLASSLEMEGDTAVIERDIEGGKEVVEASLPMVVSAQKGMAEARIPNMRGIMAARTKPLQVLEPVAAENLTSIEKYELPKQRENCRMVSPDNVAELVELLHTEAKVI